MFKRIIVGVDGEPGGRDAVALAKRLRGDGELTLAFIYAGETQPWRGSSPAYDVAERERARELLERAQSEAGIEASIRWHGASSPGRGLHELAEIVDADLLVVGSSSRGLLHRVLVGDDTRSALDGAPCAVAVAPTGFAGHPAVMREIGVGYDGSPDSEHALLTARTLADELGTKLSAFEAVTLPTHTFSGPVAADRTTLKLMVDQARERIAELGGVEAHAAYGDAAEELAVYGASLDLLVIGSRGYGPAGRLVHGSTAHELARRARCPLLVLPRSTPVGETAGGNGSATVARA